MIHVFLVGLILLMAEPKHGTQVVTTVQEGRKILLLIDASSSMEGAALQSAKAVAETFIRQRPPSDSIGVVLFNDTASGGIMSRNHTGLIRELRHQEGVRISGTQLGLGLFKGLASFMEDEVETALWQHHNISGEKRQRYFQQTHDEIDRLGRHLMNKAKGEFILRLPMVSETQRLGRGKVLIVLSDARVQLSHAWQEVIDHRDAFQLYDNMGFERLYFISVEALPKEVVQIFQRHTHWRFFRIHNMADRQRLAQIYDDIDRIEQPRNHIEVRTIPKALYRYGYPLLILVPIAIVLRILPPFRSFQ